MTEMVAGVPLALVVAVFAAHHVGQHPGIPLHVRQRIAMLCRLDPTDTVNVVVIVDIVTRMGTGIIVAASSVAATVIYVVWVAAAKGK